MLVFFGLFFASFLLVFGETSNNKYDTVNQGCTRVRKAWHLLDVEERQLFVEGLVLLRNKDDFDQDWFMLLSDIHLLKYVGGAIHKSSANHFWHGYIIWELESRIRELGDKFKCFALPYYDTTIDYGLEANPSILDGVGGLGTTGDADDAYAVKDFASFLPQYDANNPSAIFWTHNHPACSASVDSHPFCTIKRYGVGDEEQYLIVDSAEEQSPLFQYGNTYDSLWAFMHKYQRGKHDPLSFIGFPNHTLRNKYYGHFQSYEPIWWMLHSFIQYQLSLWVDCHGYANDPVSGYNNGYENLTLSGDLYEKYCVDNDYCKFGLDDTLYFTDILKSKKDGDLLSKLVWNNKDISVRELWDHSVWNVQYEIGDFLESADLYDSVCNFDNYLSTNKWIDDKSLYQKDNAFRKLLKNEHFIYGALIVLVLSSLFIFSKFNYSTKESIKYSQIRSYGSVSI